MSLGFIPTYKKSNTLEYKGKVEDKTLLFSFFSKEWAFF